MLQINMRQVLVFIKSHSNKYTQNILLHNIFHVCMYVYILVGLDYLMEERMTVNFV